MKITRTKITEMVKAALIEQEQETEKKTEPGQDKTGKRAGTTAVQTADEVVDGMLQKSASLGPRIEQLRTTDQRKLALTRALLTKVVGMQPSAVDRMLQLLVQSLK
ncbi:MAG: hypothetical protein VW270_16550 [Candidatus Poseidoniales archaeon]